MSVAYAQSLTAGDIAGTVTDPSGAAVVGATVKATSNENGSVATATTSGTGAYRFSLMKPGAYVLITSATGFKAASATVTVAIGQITTQNIALALGAASETIQVSATSQLLQTDTAQLSTEVSFEQMQDIPNPGGDITYEAQSKPGVIMNSEAGTSSGLTGYGNFSAFGMSATANNFTVNGMQVNDPFLNLNNSGPSNLLLGLNDIQETNVVTNAYEVEYGSFGGLQMNSISRSGSDQFHGNLNYSWNGRSINANDTYNKNPNYVGPTALGRPFSNFNQWAGAVGGPVWKKKLFFFFNTEGISFITSSQAVVYLPDPTFESSVVGTDAKCDDASSSLFTSGMASECTFYNSALALYNGTPGISHAVESTTVPGQLDLSVPSKFKLTEKMYTGRVDTNPTANDKAFVHFKYDNGVQPTYTDPINAAFDADSQQPDYEGQLSETHSFGTRAVNVFLMTGSYYSALFVNPDPSKELSTFPMEMEWFDGFASTLNNNALAWPEGRNVTQYQFGDDFSYTKGKHTLKAGVAFKKDDVSDYDTGVLQTPLVFTDQAYGDFQSGQSLLGVQNFTTNLDLPLSLYTLGFYVQDQWKPISKATVTAGIRVERNSNVACRKNCLANFGGDFFSLASGAPLNSTSGAYNQQIKSGLSSAFTNYQAFMIEPRVGFNYSPDAKTVVRGGFGIFTDVFPGTIADTMLDNPPLTLEFQILGSAFGGSTMPLQPTASGSYQQLAAGANTTFQSGFKAGGSADSMMAANPNYSVPSFTSVAAKLHYPTYNEWNLQIQRQLSHSQSIQVGYVGDRGYHEPVESVGVNAVGGFGLPTSAAPAPSFGPITEVDSTAVSHYNGLLASYLFQGHGLNAQFNYQWSHALDEISNGGILPFDAGSIEYQDNPHRLRDQYGNADYDVRQYFSGNYLYQMPHLGGPKILTGGWQIGGTIYFGSGNPFTPVAYVSDFGIGNFGGGSNVVPIALSSTAPRHCGPSSANPNTPCFHLPNLPATSTPGATMTSTDFPTEVWTNTAAAAGPANWVVGPTATAVPFGQEHRNQVFGPRFFDTDATLLKAFTVPHTTEQTKLEVGLTAFNLLNHPNFGLPNSNIDGGNFGITTVAVGPPTSIYGAGLGGDPSIRIVELNARFVF
ncbi:MAG: carboxypeptidase regulatory-like domain-containing protein [Bryobacteraceae bacterium]